MPTQVSPLQSSLRNPTPMGARTIRRTPADSSANPLDKTAPSFDLQRPTEPVRPGQTPQPTRSVEAESESSFSLWDKDGFNLGDLLDIINPLQHIPIVSTIYRAFTSDDIGIAPRILGGALYGGIAGTVYGVATGLASAAVNAVVDYSTGKDIGEHAYAMFFGDPNRPEGQTIRVAGLVPPEPPAREPQTAVIPVTYKQSPQPESQREGRPIEGTSGESGREMRTSDWELLRQLWSSSGSLGDEAVNSALKEYRRIDRMMDRTDSDFNP